MIRPKQTRTTLKPGDLAVGTIRGLEAELQRCDIEIAGEIYDTDRRMDLVAEQSRVEGRLRSLKEQYGER